METCGDCGFAYNPANVADAGPSILRGADDFVQILAGRPDELTRRANPSIWSPLEYGCHLRDILLVQRERVLLARRAVRPILEQMGRDEHADHDGYAEQEPTNVARQLRDAAMLFTNDLSRLGPEDWYRTVMYNYPTLTERTIGWVALHTAHELQHHFLDARRQLS